MTIRTCSKAPIAFALAALMAPAAFASGEGQAVGVDPDAVARINSGDRTLVVGSDLSVGETVVTGPRGQVQILFADQTRLAVGPGSSLKIETYLLRNNGTAETFVVNALAGSFRFISGNSPKSAYQIRTPTAAIGVRGTKFDVLVGGGTTRTMLYEGALQICSGGQCAQVTDRCEIGEASGGNATLYERNDPQRLPLSGQFYYARFQTPLLSAFRVNGAGQCLSQAEGPSNNAITENGGSNEDNSGQPTGGGGNSSGGGSTPSGGGSTPSGGGSTPSGSSTPSGGGSTSSGPSGGGSTGGPFSST